VETNGGGGDRHEYYYCCRRAAVNARVRTPPIIISCDRRIENVSALFRAGRMYGPPIAGTPCLRLLFARVVDVRRMKTRGPDAAALFSTPLPPRPSPAHRFVYGANNRRYCRDGRTNTPTPTAKIVRRGCDDVARQ